MTPRDWYRKRLRVWTSRHDAASAHSVRLSRLRLVTFFAGVVLVWWGGASRNPWMLITGAASFAAFGWCVVRHARVLGEIERADAARSLNEQGLARLARDWHALPEIPPPAGLDSDAHPYTRDLDLFGHASLTKWLGAAATHDGFGRLCAWLLHPCEAEETAFRQSAVEELASKREWREALAIEGRLTVAGASELDRFLVWAESAGSVVPAAARIAAYALPPATWTLLGLWVSDRSEAAWWLIPLVLSIVVSFALARRIYAVFDRAALGQRALDRYAAMLSLACGGAWTAPELVRLEHLLRDGGSAPARVKRLARLVGWSELKSGAALLHFPIQALTLWDFHVLFALERWRVRSGRHVRSWFDALGSFDALAVLSTIRADQPDWATPRVDPSLDALTATALGHPLIHDDQRVSNDVRVGPPGTILLVTGSNMSGKSTLLRAIGLNTVLAHAGAPVCAAAFQMPSADLRTSIRVQDSLELGLSYFMAALARLKQIVDRAEQDHGSGRVLLYLLDEVLQGTNSVERGLAVRAVVRHLLHARAIGAMTTHDLSLAGEEPLRSAATLVHFTEQVHPDGRMTFDYRLRPGVATSTNALRLMQLIGITPE